MAALDDSVSSTETCDPRAHPPPMRLAQSAIAKTDLSRVSGECPSSHRVAKRNPVIADANAVLCLRELTTPIDALRIVLSIALDRNVAAQCLDGASEECLSRWPSSLYGILAAEAVRSRAVWQRCSRQIERALGELGKRFASLPPSSLTRLLGEGAPFLTNHELAALLWAQLNQRESMREPMPLRADPSQVAKDFDETALATNQQ